MLRKLLIIIAILVVVGVGVFVVMRNEATAPSPTDVPIVSATPEPNITIESPRPNERVSNPIVVKGKARVFENTFAYVLRDRKGNKLYENYAMSDAPDAGVFGSYTVKIPVPSSAPAEFVVEVFEYSAKDGEVINLVQVPVRLAFQEKSSVKVHFSNSKFDPEYSCEKTFPVTRTIYKTQEPAFMALSELLLGVTEQEKNAGYFTNINRGVRINSIKITNGTAYVDFDQTLEAEVGGSCRVSAIRWQIANTLKEFPTVKNVVISINGRTEDILQP